MKQNCISSSSGNGSVQFQLPIGFRFRPTDEELILHYLNPKVHSSPFPTSVIPILPHHTIFHSHPAHLPGDEKERRHFFCNKNSDSFAKNGSKRRMRITISDGSGYWKAIGKGKIIHVIAPGSLTPVVGIKKSMAFYQGKPFHGLKTPWVMHQYHLLSSQTNTPYSTQKELENWVVCRISQRKRKSKNLGYKKNSRTMEEVIRPNNESVMDFLISLPHSPSCSSGSTISSTPFF